MTNLHEREPAQPSGQIELLQPTSGLNAVRVLIYFETYLQEEKNRKLIYRRPEFVFDILSLVAGLEENEFFRAHIVRRSLAGLRPDEMRIARERGNLATYMLSDEQCGQLHQQVGHTNELSRFFLRDLLDELARLYDTKYAQDNSHQFRSKDEFEMLNIFFRQQTVTDGGTRLLTARKAPDVTGVVSRLYRLAKGESMPDLSAEQPETIKKPREVPILSQREADQINRGLQIISKLDLDIIRAKVRDSQAMNSFPEEIAKALIDRLTDEQVSQIIINRELLVKYSKPVFILLLQKFRGSSSRTR